MAQPAVTVNGHTVTVVIDDGCNDPALTPAGGGGLAFVWDSKQGA